MSFVSDIFSLKIIYPKYLLVLYLYSIFKTLNYWSENVQKNGMIVIWGPLAVQTRHGKRRTVNDISVVKAIKTKKKLWNIIYFVRRRFGKNILVAAYNYCTDMRDSSRTAIGDRSALRVHSSCINMLLLTTITILFNTILLKGHAKRPRTDAIVLHLFAARSQVEFFVLFFFFFAQGRGADTGYTCGALSKKKKKTGRVTTRKPSSTDDDANDNVLNLPGQKHIRG